MAGLGAFALVYLSTTGMVDRTQANNLVGVTLHNAVQELEAAQFSTLVSEFGPGGAKEFFWCEDDGALLFSDPGDAGVAGRFFLYNDEQNIPPEFADLGSEPDINANLTVDTAPVNDYLILPVRIVLTMRNVSPSDEVTLDLILTDG